MLKNIFVLVTLILGLAACTEKHDVAYYRSHTSERDAKAASCSGSALDNDDECIAAISAEEIKPVSYWKENSAERKLKIGFCKEHAASLGQSDNCRNAQQAHISAFGSGGKAVYLSGSSSSPTTK